jgi:large subunit ribosomal protein L9
MDIILLDHIDKVGAKHDVVKVKDGYGRNFLIPRGLAIVANRTNMARLDGLKKQAAKKEAALVESLKAIAAKLVGISLKITAKAGESGRLFGSVTSQHVAAALKDQAGVEVDKRLIEMPEEVKEIGAYTAVIKFHPEVVSELRFDVASENNRNDHD